MDYSTDSIAAIAQQVAKAFQAAVVTHQQAGGPALTIAEVETGMRQFLRQVGLQSLSQFLSTGAGTPVAEIACRCGGRLHYQRRREATITSVFGRLRYERAIMRAVVVDGEPPHWMSSMGSNRGRSPVGWRHC